MSRPVLRYRGKDIYDKEIIKALREVGIKEGDTIFVHSDLSKFGKLENVKSKDEFIDIFIDIFLKIVGKNGTVIVPTFSYSFTKNEDFDIANTKSTVGILTERFRKRANAIRSNHPIFSVAAIGKDAYFFTQNLSQSCFGKDSVFDRMLQKNTKIVLFGVPEFMFTYIHYVEESFGVPYRYHKQFTGRIIDGEKEYYAESSYYVRDLEINPVTDLTKLYNEMKAREMIKETKIGNGRIIVISCKDVFIVATEMLQKDIYFLLKEKPLRGVKK